jgi:thiamine-monophosphate kinase
MIYAMGAEKDPLDYILFGGEDYQLIGTMPAEHAIAMQMKFREAGLTLYIIGYVNGEAEGVRLVQSNGYAVPIEKQGYNHFRKG